MSTAEKPTLRMRPHDEPIFVAGDDRRARLLGRAAAVATFVALLWVVGLGIGMLGFDSLPGASLVRGSHAPPPVAPVAEIPAAAARDAARAIVSATTAAPALDRAQTAGRSTQQTARARRRASTKATRVAATRPVAPPPAVNPAQRTRGWARRGNLAPPGQIRRTEPPPPPPATSKGKRVGQTQPPPAPVVPPGQAKKALDPLPPPPPPKKG
jgi:hypothetical protein